MSKFGMAPMETSPVESMDEDHIADVDIGSCGEESSSSECDPLQPQCGIDEDELGDTFVNYVDSCDEHEDTGSDDDEDPQVNDVDDVVLCFCLNLMDLKVTVFVLFFGVFLFMS